MFDHVMIAVSDRGASERFYDTVLGVLGVPGLRAGERTVWEDFWLSEPEDGGAVTRGLHVGFQASSRKQVDAFWQAGTEAGFRDDGPPGPRPQYRDDYYGGFLLDPDGNSMEAVHHGGMRGGSVIDHVWVRVADLAASKAFYKDLAPRAGIWGAANRPELTRFEGRSSTLSLVAGEPTQNVHLAFPVPGDATVEALRDPDGNPVEV